MKRDSIEIQLSASNKKDEEKVVQINKDYIQTCFVNVDDEQSILKINTRLFSKQGLELNTCKCGQDLYNLLEYMNADRWFNRKKILVIMDYKLETE